MYLQKKLYGSLASKAILQSEKKPTEINTGEGTPKGEILEKSNCSFLTNENTKKKRNKEDYITVRF